MKTIIEQWIDGKSKQFNLDSHSLASVQIACKDLLLYLGLSGIDNPREWVEVTKEERVEAHVSFWKEKAENNQWRCNQLQSGITKLQAELKQAKADKAEAWDEGFKSGKNYVESSMSCDEGVRLPENPYKPDFNQNSMLERFGELEDEFKVE